MENNSSPHEESWADLFKRSVNLLQHQVNETSLQGFFTKSFIIGLLISSVVGMVIIPKFFMPPFDTPTEGVHNGWLVGVLIIIGTLNFIYLSLYAKGDKWQRLNKTISGGAGMSMGLAGGPYILVPLLTALIIVALFVGLYKIISLNVRAKQQKETNNRGEKQ